MPRSALTRRRVGKAFAALGHLGESTVRRAIRARVLPGMEHLVALDLIAPRSVLDVGANRGQFAVAALCCPSVTNVVAFEPLDAERAVLERCIGGDPRTTIVGLALADDVGEETFNVSARPDSSSLLGPTDAQIEAFPGTGSARQIRVPVSTLDAVLRGAVGESPVLLKIDVQGAELRVLRGGRQTLQSVDAVYVEASYVELYEGQALFGELAAFLREAGFEFVGAFNASCDHGGVPIQADCLFVR